MKVVLDTNVYLSAFLFRGTAAKTPKFFGVAIMMQDIEFFL